MVDTAPAVVPKAKVYKPKKPTDHPKYSEMVKAAIAELKDRGGSSRRKILKYILSNYKVGEEKTVNTHLKIALRTGVKSGLLNQSKGTGASGSFRLSDAAKKAPAKPQKPAAKTPAIKKPAAKTPAIKKPAAKTPDDKKPAAKTPADKKPAAKKPADKKPAAKKPADKKPAAKKPADKKPAAKTPADKKAAKVKKPKSPGKNATKVKKPKSPAKKTDDKKSIKKQSSKKSPPKKPKAATAAVRKPVKKTP